MEFKRLKEARLSDIGWDFDFDTYPEIEDTLLDLNDFVYEIKNTVRGHFTQATTNKELAKYIRNNLINSLFAMADTIENMEDTSVRESLKNTEIDDFFLKAKKLGVKTLGDLKKLMDEPEHYTKTGRTRSDIQTMKSYSKAANPKNLDLKN